MACTITTILVQLEIVSPFRLYFHPRLIMQGEVWRLITTFTYFGRLGFSFLFNMIFTYRYCCMLEEASFYQKTADFVFMFLFGACFTLIIGVFIQLLFLGHAFTMMLVYIWSRRNPWIRLNFFGLLNFNAPYLPYVLAGFSILFGSSATVDVIGIIVGHTYYYLEDIYPNRPGGRRLLQTPQFLKYLLDPVPEAETEVDIDIPEDERIGGWEWRREVGQDNANNRDNELNE